MNLTQVWEIIKEAVKDFGWAGGTFLLFFWVAHYWLFRMYNGRLQDRQAEIDRLAADNREYRDRFLTVLDRHLGLPPKPEAGQQTLPEPEATRAALPESDRGEDAGKDKDKDKDKGEDEDKGKGKGKAGK